MSTSSHIEDLMKQWTRSLALMHIAHHEAASFYGGWHLTLGVMVVILSAVLGASIGEFIYPEDPARSKLLTVLLGMLSALFAGVQTFVDAGGRSKSHHTSAAAFAEARRELEQLAATGVPSVEDVTTVLDDVRRKWNSALAAAPNLPRAIHKRVGAQVDDLLKG
jgi:hypothetical protein